MIHDRLVVGILDMSLSERLQMDANLTLEKAKQIVRQHEAVQKQQTTLHRGEQPSETMVSYVSSRERRGAAAESRALRRRGSSVSTARSLVGVGRAHTRVAPALLRKPPATSARRKLPTASWMPTVGFDKSLLRRSHVI